MRWAFEGVKIVAEPGGTTALAALPTGHYQGRDRVITVVLSGGNNDAETFAARLVS